MSGRFRLPMLASAVALLGLIALLATLQYRWLGQISAAERDRMAATLRTRASGFAEDFDRELNRAYSALSGRPHRRRRQHRRPDGGPLRPLAGDVPLPADDQGHLPVLSAWRRGASGASIPPRRFSSPRNGPPRSTTSRRELIAPHAPAPPARRPAFAFHAGCGRMCRRWSYRRRDVLTPDSTPPAVAPDRAPHVLRGPAAGWPLHPRRDAAGARPEILRGEE